MIKRIALWGASALAVGAAVVLYDWALWYNVVGAYFRDQPSFTNALENYPTTEVVPGKLRQTFEDALNQDERYAAAIAYAEAMESDSLLIWQGGELRVERYWKDNDRNMRPETASMHKSVLGLAYGLAIEDGYIKSVDDPVKNYVPEWSNDPRGDVSIRDLLTMSSGFLPYPPSQNPYSDSRQLLFGMRLEKLMLELEASHPPGEMFFYANVNSQLLGVILERATGARYAEFVSERLWQPLGADNAYVWLDRNGGLARTYAAFLARPIDWLRLGIMIKDEGRSGDRQIVLSSWIAEMTSPSRLEPNYGYQIWLSNEDLRKRYYNEADTGVGFAISEAFVSEDLIYFDGIGGQRVFVSRADDYVIVRTGPPRIDWDEAVLPNAVVNASN